MASARTTLAMLHLGPYGQFKRYLYRYAADPVVNILFFVSSPLAGSAIPAQQEMMPVAVWAVARYLVGPAGVILAVLALGWAQFGRYQRDLAWQALREAEQALADPYRLEDLQAEVGSTYMDSHFGPGTFAEIARVVVTRLTGWMDEAFLLSIVEAELQPEIASRAGSRPTKLRRVERIFVRDLARLQLLDSQLIAVTEAPGGTIPVEYYRLSPRGHAFALDLQRQLGESANLLKEAVR